MKKKIYFCFMLAFLAVFTVSCSQTEDMEPTDIPETRADSPLLVVSPTEIFFDNPELYDLVSDSVNIQTAGLSSLAVLTNFDVTVQGPDKSHFLAEKPSLSLAGILQAILGGGIEIPVSFITDKAGSFEAELLITASLLGVLMPVQITVPLHATIDDISIPQLLYTEPEDGGTVQWEARVPDESTVGKGQYHIDFVFDKNIYIRNISGIRVVQYTSAQIQKAEIINGNILRLTIWESAIAVTNIIQIDPNSITTREGYLGDIGNEAISIVYTATGTIPDNEV